MPGTPRHVGAAADVDEDLPGLEPVGADPDLRGVRRSGHGRRGPVDARVLAQALLDALVGDPDDRVLPRFDRLHVDLDLALDHHPELGRPARHVRRPGARDQGLGRDAAVVDAGAAEALALDDRDLAALPDEAAGQRRPRLSGADDDRIIACGHCPSLLAPHRPSPPRPAAADGCLPPALRQSGRRGAGHEGREAPTPSTIGSLRGNANSVSTRYLPLIPIFATSGRGRQPAGLLKAVGTGPDRRRGRLTARAGPGNRPDDIGTLTSRASPRIDPPWAVKSGSMTRPRAPRAGERLWKCIKFATFLRFARR